MIRFDCDYTEGAHPKILEQLVATNMVQTIGYGEDRYCVEAAKLIKKACEREDVDVHLLVGGTQTNTTVITSVLRPHQGVVCANSGHINIHESGAIENRGHKVLPLACGNDGKISANQILEYHRAHWSDESFEHIVQPGMVYISFPTENGTIYSRKELTDIYSVCKELSLPLFIDGARLGYGLAAASCDVTLPDLARLCDVFYIGGTKVGCLMGEAVVICNDKLKKDFRYIIKQQGGLLAKGRLLGIQFAELFRDGLYFSISQHAIDMAMAIREAFRARDVEFYIESETNQQFPILNVQQVKYFAEKYSMATWAKLTSELTAVRFCTSWATLKENVEQLVEDIKLMPK